MITFVLAAAVSSALATNEVVLTFDEALSRLSGERNVVVAPHPRSTRPVVRLETDASVSRSAELFFKTPFELRAAIAVVSVEYPLFDRRRQSLLSSIDRTEAEALSAAQAPSEEDISALIDAFGDLYAARAESDALAPALDEISSFAARGGALVSSGYASIATESTWDDAALALQMRMIDVQLRRVDSLTRLQELLRTTDTIVPRLSDDVRSADASDVDSFISGHPDVAAAAREVERSRIRVEQVELQRKPEVTLSGYGGVGAAQSRFQDVASDGTFGVYALRIHAAFSLFQSELAGEVASARLELELAEARKDAIEKRVRRELAARVVRVKAADEKVALLQQAVDIANRRMESMTRLVSAGARGEFDRLSAEAELAMRKGELERARIEQWKSLETLQHGYSARMASDRSEGPAQK